MSDQFFTPTGNFVARGADKVNPALVDILDEAANRLGVKVEAYSGYRPGDPRFHGKGMATDIRIIGADGKAIPNYQSAEGFSQYEKLAQEARKVQMEKYPNLDQNFRWGGYFGGPKGKYGAMDLMHFDLGGSAKLGMAGGSWDKGLSDRQAALFGMDNYKARGLENLAVPPQNRSVQVASTFDPTAFGAVPLDAPTAPAAAAPATPDAAQAAFAPDQPVAPAVGALDNLVQPVAAKPGYQVVQNSKPVPFDPVAAGATPFDPTQLGAVPVGDTGAVPVQGFGSIEGTTPSVMERVGNTLYDAGKAIGLPVDQMRRDNQSADAFIRGAADIGTFGTADEIAAQADALTGMGGKQGDYEGNLRYQRAVDANDVQQHPVARGAGQLAGGVGIGMIAGPAAAAPNAIGRVAQGVRLGATYGGLYGFGSGEGGVGNRLKSGAAGALAGGAIGAAVPAATALVGKTYNTLADVMMRPAANAIRSVVSPEANALRLTQRALARDSLTPDQAGAKMQQAINAGDDTTMLMDVGGENTRRLGRAATNIPGEGADKIKGAVFDRQLAQPERVAEAVRKGLDDPANYFSTVDDIIAQRQTAAKPLYDQAYNTPVPFTQKLESLLGRGKVMQKALAGARDMASAEGIPSKQFFAQIADDGSYTINSVPDAKQWDYMKRSLDDIISSETETLPNGSEKLSNMGRVVAGIRREMLTEIDKYNPAYAQARKVYSTASESLDAVTKGGKILDADPELAKRTLAEMSDGDKQLARLGISKALVDRVQKARDGANVVRGIFASPRNRAVLKEAFPTEASFNDFKSAMEREAQKTRTNVAIGGNSTTAAQAADLASNFDAGVAGHIISGRPVAAVGAIIQKALARATVVNEATAKELANILTTTDPAVSQQIMAQMQRMAMKDQRVAKNLVRVSSLLRNSSIVTGTKAAKDNLVPAGN